MVVLTLLTGIVYPVAMTLDAQALFPDRASGSILVVDGTSVSRAPHTGQRDQTTR